MKTGILSKTMWEDIDRYMHVEICGKAISVVGWVGTVAFIETMWTGIFR